MKVAKFVYGEDINPNIVEDLLSLSKYIMMRFDCYITLRDTYNLWIKVSRKEASVDWILFSNLDEAHKEILVATGLRNYCIVRGD